MTDHNNGAFAEAQQLNISDYMEDAYMNYSMYVIMDRSLPHIGDGFKPVHRRIVYAMHGLSLTHKAKYKKSARTIGDVLGKYHPHGDSACYEAMVAMAQPFSCSMPLVDGQGNWGSQDDPKSFAAMRYTESKMMPYAQLMLTEINDDTVDFKPNFDGTLKEPTVLPARAPNILINGTSGIAVGMATDILPHNLREVINGTIFMIDNPESTTAEVMKYIRAPDFPTGGLIVSTRQDIRKAYESGRGSIKVRAIYTVEKNKIIISELPYQVSGSKLLEKIGELIIAKKLNMIDDIQDHSDEDHPTHLEITLKRSAKIDPDTFMSHMFSITDLEKSYRVNMNMLGLDGSPEVKGLVTILNEWIEFRRNTVTRRIENRVRKINERLHIIDGLLVAYLNIDEVIEIIRTKDDPKEVLMKRFSITEIQANAILDIRLRNLAKLEEFQLRSEKDELETERDGLNVILESPEKMNNLLKEELEVIREEHKGNRRSRINKEELIEAKALTEDQLISAEKVTVLLSYKGWIRSAKGHDIDDAKLNYKTGDKPLAVLPTHSNKPTIVMDADGRTFVIKTHQLQSARSYGEHLSTKVTPQSNVPLLALLDHTESAKYLLASKEGCGFICKTESMMSSNKKGKAVLAVENNSALMPYSYEDQTHIALITKKNMIVIFENDLKELGKGKGMKLINLDDDDELAYIVPLNVEDTLVLEGAQVLNYTYKQWEKYITKRNRKGKKLHRKVTGVSIEKGESLDPIAEDKHLPDAPEAHDTPNSMGEEFTQNESQMELLGNSEAIKDDKPEMDDIDRAINDIFNS